MKAKNQLVVLSGILVLLATATIAATYNVQTAKAAFGKDIVSGLAQTHSLTQYVLPAAHAGTQGSHVSSYVHEHGCKWTSRKLPLNIEPQINPTEDLQPIFFTFSTLTCLLHESITLFS